MTKRRFRPILTPFGTAFLVVVLVILIRSLVTQNSYEIVLSSAALVLLLFLGVFGTWKSRKLESLESGWKPPYPMTANAGEEWLVTGLGVPLPLFFRLHFIVCGRFFPAGSYKSCPVFTEISVSRGEEKAKLYLDFPLSGIFQGNGSCRLRDVFGFFSFFCGKPEQRTVKIRSAPCFGKKIFINAQSGAEDKRNKQSSDEERYYMREYTPGDRFRDINWKSSEKIDSLITRISPDNQEKVSRIEICFRNYGPLDKPSLEALWLLDRAKARLSQFLRNLMEEQSSFIFNVRCAQGSWEIEDNDDLENFLEELAGFSFLPPQNEAIVPAANYAAQTGELYVFSTACDFTLNSFLLACNPRPVSLFLAQPQGLKIPGVKPEILRKRDFPAMGSFPLPRWLFTSKIKQLGVNTGRVEMIYAETKF